MSEVKRGRPSTGKVGTFSFRVRGDLRAKLTDAASLNQRSVSEEIEAIITRHFEVDVMREMMRELLDQKMKGSIW